MIPNIKIFLLAAPKEIKLEKVKSDILEVNRIKSIHQTHLWSFDGIRHIFSTHILLNDNINNIKVVSNIKTTVKKKLQSYGFEYITIEIELPEYSKGKV